MQEQLYTSATVILSPRSAITNSAPRQSQRGLITIQEKCGLSTERCKFL